MATPLERTPIKIARGTLADLTASKPVFGVGELLWAEDRDQLYVVEKLGAGTVFTPAAAPGATGTGATSTGATVISSPTAPAAPADNSLWFNSTTGALFIFYNDGATSAWLQVAPGASGPQASGAAFSAGPTPPAAPADNELWLNTATGKLLVFYDGGSAKAWLALT